MSVHRSPGICLTAEKTLARRPSDEGVVRPVIASNGVHFLQVRSVGSHNTSGKEKEGIKESTGMSRPRPLSPKGKHINIWYKIVTQKSMVIVSVQKILVFFLAILQKQYCDAVNRTHVGGKKCNELVW